MYKLILFTLLAGFLMVLHALQADEEISMHTLFHAKHSLNRAVHAAAQQADAAKLARGIVSIDPGEARATALRYLQANMRLDESNIPLPDTFLKAKVDLLAFEVINEDHVFPYRYSNSAYSYSVELKRPAVVMIIRLEYPRTYPVLGPIVWEIKGSSELVF